MTLQEILIQETGNFITSSFTTVVWVLTFIGIGYFAIKAMNKGFNKIVKSIEKGAENIKQETPKWLHQYDKIKEKDRAIRGAMRA